MLSPRELINLQVIRPPKSSNIVRLPVYIVHEFMPSVPDDVRRHGRRIQPIGSDTTWPDLVQNVIDLDDLSPLPTPRDGAKASAAGAPLMAAWERPTTESAGAVSGLVQAAEAKLQHRIQCAVPPRSSSAVSLKRPALPGSVGVGACASCSYLARPSALDLHDLCDAGKMTDVLEHIHAGADVHARHPSTGRTLLHCAAASGNRLAVIALLQAGCPPQARCTEGRSALDDALANGHVALAKLLPWSHGGLRQSPSAAAPREGLALTSTDERPLGVVLPPCGQGRWFAVGFEPPETHNAHSYLGATPRFVDVSHSWDGSRDGSVLLEHEDHSPCSLL